MNDGLILLFTALLSLFTFLLWRATAGLWNATRGMLNAAQEQARDFKESLKVAQVSAEAARRSAEVAQQTLQITQRPVMALESLDSSVRDVGTLPILEITVTWKNCGAAFALNCSLETGYQLVDGDNLARPLAPPPAPSAGQIAPGSLIEAAPVQISMADLALAFMASKTLILWARCGYSSHLVESLREASRFETLYGYVVEVPNSPAHWSVGDIPEIRFRSSAKIGQAS